MKNLKTKNIYIYLKLENLFNNFKTMTKNITNTDESLEVGDTKENEIEAEKPKIPVTNYKRPPAFTNNNVFSKWKIQQNANTTKMVRRSWWRWR